MEEKEAARVFASMGGKALLKKRGKKYFKELSKKGIEKRRELQKQREAANA